MDSAAQVMLLGMPAGTVCLVAASIVSVPLSQAMQVALDRQARLVAAVAVAVVDPDKASQRADRVYQTALAPR